MKCWIHWCTHITIIAVIHPKKQKSAIVIHSIIIYKTKLLKLKAIILSQMGYDAMVDLMGGKCNLPKEKNKRSDTSQHFSYKTLKQVGYYN